MTAKKRRAVFQPHIRPRGVVPAIWRRIRVWEHTVEESGGPWLYLVRLRNR